MWKKLKAFMGLTKPATKPPLDIVDRIGYNLGILSHDVIDRYDTRKAMATRLVLSSESPRVLRDWIASAAHVMSSGDYASEVWKAGVRIERVVMFDDYLTHAGYVVSFPVWFEENNTRIQRIIDILKGMDAIDREYYQRMYTSVLRDVDAVLKAAVIACN